MTPGNEAVLSLVELPGIPALFGTAPPKQSCLTQKNQEGWQRRV